MKRIRNSELKLCFIVLCAIILAAVCIFRPPCPIRLLTGVPCPGCGMTHAWLAALRLDLYGAFSENAAFWVIPFAFILFLCDGKVFRRKKLNAAFIMLLVFSAGVSYVLNLCRFFYLI